MATLFKLDDDKYSVINATKAGNFNLPTGFSEVDTIEVNPGHTLCLFSGVSQRDGKIPNMCLTAGNYSLKTDIQDWVGNIKSLRLIKDCNKPVNMWDIDCNTTIDSKKVIDPCSSPASTCHENKLYYCNKLQDQGDKLDERCVSFCVQNPGKCDAFMKSYCKLNNNTNAQALTKSVCSCIDSPAAKYNPLCIDEKCIRYGYATKKMTDEVCPSELDCGIYNELKHNTILTDYSKMQKLCSASEFIKGEAQIPTSSEKVVEPNPILLAALPRQQRAKRSMSVIWKIMYINLLIICGAFIPLMFDGCRNVLGIRGCYIAIIFGLIILVYLNYQVFSTKPLIDSSLNVTITGHRWSPCKKSSDCVDNIGCRISDQNNVVGRCMSKRDCQWSTDRDRTVSPNECAPIK